MLSEEPMHKTMQAYTLESWFMDIDTAIDILTESHIYLVEAKSCGLTHTLIHEATQTGKCWDEIKGILGLKLCNTNIHTYTLCFMEIQQKDNETFTAYIHHFKIAVKWCAFDNYTVPIFIFVKAFKMHPSLQLKYTKRTLKLQLKSSDWLKT